MKIKTSEDSETPEIICRSEYVASAFSLQMLEDGDFSIQCTEIKLDNNLWYWLIINFLKISKEYKEVFGGCKN